MSQTYEAYADAIRYHARTFENMTKGTFLGVEDLEQEGWIAVDRALKKGSTNDRTFKNYVHRKIKGAMHDAIRRALPIYRDKDSYKLHVSLDAPAAQDEPDLLLHDVVAAEVPPEPELHFLELQEIGRMCLDKREMRNVLMAWNGAQTPMCFLAGALRKVRKYL